ncbi:hypothetical protein IFR05_003256 [Cadophora sp. M221]|nr:hypothetical protein IFR05_003256 [Cadophora sp. M221]
MDGASAYHQLEMQGRHAKTRRDQEDADFAAYQEKTLSDIQMEKDQKLTQLVADAKAEETKSEDVEKETSDLLEANQQRELEELRAKHEAQTSPRKGDAEHAMKRLTEKNEADKELLLSTYADKRVAAETEIEDKIQQLLLGRAMEDQAWSAELCRIADERSSQTIEVQPRVATYTPDRAAEPLQRRSVSAAATVLESTDRSTDQINLLMRGLESTKARPRVSSVTPTKRTKTKSSYENRTPPSLRRIVSDNIRTAADGDIFTTPSSSSSSNAFPSPTELLSRHPKLAPTVTPTRSVSISSASSQSATQRPGQITRSPTPHNDRRQTVGTNGRPSGMNGHQTDGLLQPCGQTQSTSFATPPKLMLSSPFKPTNHPQGISPTAREPMSRNIFQKYLPDQLFSSACPSRNKNLCQLRDSFCGGFYSWAHDSAEPTRYLRLSQGVYKPVLQQGRKTGSLEWTIDPSRIWVLKYDTDNSLVYIKRSKANNKTGVAGGEMWIVFKNEENLKGFLESYRTNWKNNSVQEIGFDDDDIPLSLMKKRR